MGLLDSDVLLGTDGTDFFPVLTDSNGVVQTQALDADGNPLDYTTPVDVTSSTLAVDDRAATLTNGRKTVTTPGTAVSIHTALACKWVTVNALTSNTQQVNVGGSGVLAVSGTSTGIPLLPGEGVTIPTGDASLVYVDARVTAEGVSFMVGS